MILTCLSVHECVKCRNIGSAGKSGAWNLRVPVSLFNTIFGTVVNLFVDLSSDLSSRHLHFQQKMAPE